MDGWLYLFVPTTGRLLELNGSAAHVWRRCDGSLTRQGLVDALVADHGGDVPEVAAVVGRALALFGDSGLLPEEEAGTQRTPGLGTSGRSPTAPP